MTRTLLAVLAGAALGAGALALAQTHGHAKGSTVKTLSAVDVGEKLDGKAARVTTLEVTWEPGAASSPHRHPGPVFGYILEGEFETKVGDGPVRRLKAGETFYEPAMALHAISRNPSDKVKTKVLAVMLHPRDVKDLVIPEPAAEKK
ncbi:MAG: cupin domain-containing protein [Gemmataceae bacterium]